MFNRSEEIKDIIVEILEVEPEELGMETHFIKDLGIDSLRSLEILAVLEKKYKIKISEESMPRMINLKQVIDVVEESMLQKASGK